MKKVPTLRFREFSGEWESKRLGKITKLTDGVHFTPIYVNSGVPFWSVETVVSNAPPKYITQEAHNDAIKRCHPEVNDILLTRIGTLAKPKLIDWNQEFSIYVSLALIKSSDNYNSKFARYYFETEYYQKDFLSKSLLTATPKKINMEDLKQTNINLPSKEEQQKIASFFCLIDNKISLQDEKVERLKDYKKGMMQKIFSRELRFKDDCGRDYPEWKEKKLKDYTEKITSKNKELAVTNVISNSAKNGLISQRDFFDKDIANQSNIDGYYVIKPGDFVYNPRKSIESPYGPINRYELQDAGVVSPLYLCFRVNSKEINGKFLAYYFKSSVWHRFIYQNSDQGVRHDRVSIKDAEFFNMDIGVPDIDEQNKIVEFLDVLDQKLQKEKDKLDSLNNHKKGLLQQMFV